MKYGYSAFSLEIIEYCDPDKLIERLLEAGAGHREQFYLDTLKPTYNILSTAGSCLGSKRTEETRAKISAALNGKIVSEETRALISKAKLGNKHTEETRAKIGAAHKGKIVSEETRALMSEARKGIKHPRYGKTPTNAMTIYVYSLDNVLVKTLPSQTAAAEWFNTSCNTVSMSLGTFLVRYFKENIILQNLYFLN